MSKVIALDPGDTTGWSVWDPDDPWNFVEAGQDQDWDVVHAIADATGLSEAMTLSPRFRHVLADHNARLVEAFEGWDTLICEDWSLYEDPARPGMPKLPLWDKCLTARQIGAYELIARYCGKRIILQPAMIKSKALKLSADETFLRPLHDNRHANDSIMHWHFYAAKQGLLHGRSEPAVA